MMALRILLRLPVRLAMALGRRGPVLLIIAALAILLVLQLRGLVPTVAATRSGNSAPLPPTPATERYLEGVRQANADIFWPVLSDELKVAWQEQGRTKAAVQQQLDTLAKQGLEIDKVTYVGGRRLAQGGAIYFYFVSSQAPNGSHQDVNYVFIVDKTGKIASVARA